MLLLEIHAQPHGDIIPIISEVQYRTVLERTADRGLLDTVLFQYT